MSIARQVVTNKLNVLHSKAHWVCRNDTVMGGRSFSQNFYDEGTETRVFTGTISLENNGGFCSSWISMQPSIDMSEYEGLYVDAVALKESTFGLMMRIYIQRNFKKKAGFDIQNISIINFIASFFLGILVALNFINNEIMLLFYTGFLGSFSTFSSFIYQLFILFRKRKFLRLFIFSFIK